MRYQLILLIPLFLTLTNIASAQIASPYFPTENHYSDDGIISPSIQAGTHGPGITATQVDHVNLYNGNLNITIPLLHVGGRGSAGYQMFANIGGFWQVNYYNNGSYSGIFPEFIVPGTKNSLDNKYVPYSPGVMNISQFSARPSYCVDNSTAPSLGMVSYDLGPYITRFIWTAADGTETTFLDKKFLGQPEPLGDGACGDAFHLPPTDRGRTFESTDGSGTIFVASQDIYDSIQDVWTSPPQTAAGVLYFRDGTQYSIDSKGRAIQIKDRNGNVTSLAYTRNNDATVDIKIVDSIGRTIGAHIAYNNGKAVPSPDVITYAGYEGAPRTITVNHAWLDGALAENQQIQDESVLFPELNGSGSLDFLVVSSVVLEDGTSTYSLAYNSYGEVASLKLPNGGAYRYVISGANGTDGVIQASPYTTYSIYRRLQERDELSDGTSLSSVTKYVPQASPSGLDPNHPTRSGTTLKVDVTDPTLQNRLLREEVHYFYGDPSSTTSLPSSPLSYPAWYEGVEFRKDVSDGTTISQTQQNVWQQRPCSQGEACWFGDPNTDTAPAHDPQMCQVNTTLDSGSPSGIVYQFDQYNNQTEKYEFDYGAAPQIGPTCSISQTGASRVTNTYYKYDYVPENILTLPTEIEIIGNEVGATKSSYYKATFGYDEQALSTENGAIPGHDDQGYGTGYAPRGNLTSQSVWTDSSTASVTKMTYDVAGNLTSVEDPNNSAASPSAAKSTTYTYTDGVYAHPNTITNQLGQVTGLTYDATSQDLIQVTDANSVSTKYDYLDPLNRLTQVRRGADLNVESQTNYTYIGLSTVKVAQDEVQKNDGAIVSYTNYDGFGRVKSEQTQEDASTITTAYSYDALGRPQSVSNPTRSESPSDFTVYQYDPLGRVLSVTAPDGSVSSNTYMANSTNAGDKAVSRDSTGRTHSTLTDALEHVYQVNEDPPQTDQSAPDPLAPHTNYETDYKYDALDDLRIVTQGSQTRTFIYDQAGRLRYATNPESGTVGYLYDYNGNLKTRTDARGVTTTYDYDLLNRLRDKIYSDGTTPEVTFSYDASPVSGRNVTYAIGRLTQAATNNMSTATDYLNYDALGRVTQSDQVTAGQTYTFSYQYNLVGSLTLETYPSGRAIVQCYDHAGRVTQVGGTCGQTAGYVNNVAYSPQGTLSQFQYGKDMYHAVTYDNRLRPSSIQDAVNNDSAHALFQINNSWDFNGNLTAVAQTNGGPGYAQPLTFQQSFHYDNLNRLHTASDSGGWSRTYDYDQFGNQWQDATQSSGIAASGLMPVSNVYNSHNQPTGSGGFDAAGNQTSLGTYTLAYDAENHQTSVSDATGTEVQVGYDAFGNRVTKNARVYVYDAFGNLAAEYNNAPAEAVACGTCYLGSDDLGSTRLVTDSQDTVISRHDFLPFGDEIDAKAASRNSEWGATGDNIAQRFTGQARDRETAPALDYFNARYYSSAVARFTSTDPGNLGANITNPQSWNGYAYVLGNPLNGRDPTGMDCVTLDNGSTGDVDGPGGTCPGSQDPYVTGVSADGPPDISPLWSLSGDPIGIQIRPPGFGIFNDFINGRTLYPSITAPSQSSRSSNANEKAEDARVRCGTSLLGEGILAGLSDFFGVGPDPDPTGDFNKPTRDVLDNPAFKAAAAITVSNVAKRFITARAAGTLAAGMAEIGIPAAGWTVFGFQVWHAVRAGSSYVQARAAAGACSNF